MTSISYGISIKKWYIITLLFITTSLISQYDVKETKKDYFKTINSQHSIKQQEQTYKNDQCLLDNFILGLLVVSMIIALFIYLDFSRMS